MQPYPNQETLRKVLTKREVSTGLAFPSIHASPVIKIKTQSRFGKMK